MVLPRPATVRASASWLGAAAIGAGVLLTGCTGSADPGTDAAASPPATSAASSATPAEQSGEERSITRDGVAIDVPAGWSATGLEAEQRQQSIDAAKDPALKQFLTQRLAEAAANGGIMYLYDSRGIAAGEVATVEVYGFPDAASVRAVVDSVVVPRLSTGGLEPQVAPTTLPAGPATQVTAAAAAPSGLAVRNVVLVLKLGDRIVSASGTDTGQRTPELDEVLKTIRVG